MGKGGGGSMPSPDPAIGLAAFKQAETGEGWLNFSRDAFKVSTERQAELDKLTNQVTQQQLGIGEFQLANARADRARYEQKGISAQETFAKEAGEYGSAANQETAAGEAAADVTLQSQLAKDTARREASAVGIDPGSGQYAGINRAGEAGTALGVAGARNVARRGVRDKGLALKADVANMYAGLPAQSGAGIGQALAAGSSAVGMGQAGQQISNQNANVMAQGYQGAMAGYQGQASTLSNLYGLNLDRWRIGQEASSANAAGLFGAIGTGIGAFAALSDRKAKKNVKGVKKGAALKAVKKMPVKKFDYKPGLGDGGRGHVGPMADDFAKATGQPDTGVVKFQDAIGITMKAVQDLSDKVDRLDKKGGGKASKPTPRRASQSPAKARPTKVEAAKPIVTAKNASLGLRRV